MEFQPQSKFFRIREGRFQGKPPNGLGTAKPRIHPKSEEPRYVYTYVCLEHCYWLTLLFLFHRYSGLLYNKIVDLGEFQHKKVGTVGLKVMNGIGREQIIDRFGTPRRRQQALLPLLKHQISKHARL